MFNTQTPAFFSRREMADDHIRAVAPSMFAAAPLPEVSERYAFVPTAQIVCCAAISRHEICRGTALLSLRCPPARPAGSVRFVRNAKT